MPGYSNLPYARVVLHRSESSPFACEVSIDPRPAAECRGHRLPPGVDRCFLESATVPRSSPFVLPHSPIDVQQSARIEGERNILRWRAFKLFP
jgi:hypothetical protein